MPRPGPENVRGHIVALGGGGFSMEPDNPLLDDFVLSLARRTPARVCLVPTASADSATYLVRFYRAFAGRAVPTDLTLFGSGGLPRRPERTSEIARFVAEQDVIYVGGGNTVNLLAVWRAHGLDAVLRDAWVNGAVLYGVSAGMICWFEDGLTDSYGGLAPLGDGLGLIEGSACPHFDGEAAYRRAIEEGLRGGYAADDGVALHFAGRELAQVVTAKEGAAAYRVDLVAGRVEERKLQARFLGRTEDAAGA